MLEVSRKNGTTAAENMDMETRKDGKIWKPLLKDGLSYIPFLGPFLSELFNYYILQSLDKGVEEER
jgi:hypothetical protein